MPAGRPTKYTPEALQKAIDYVDGGYEALEHEIPSHVGMAIHLGVSSKTMYEWAKDDNKEEFRNILAKCMDNQQHVLINKGLSNKFNAQITKLVLGKHGYHEKIDQENTGKDGGAIEHKWTIEVVEAKE
jgi:dolichyl-phosphate-mannose--protein O-mannosyl transferase